MEGRATQFAADEISDIEAQKQESLETLTVSIGGSDQSRAEQ